MKTWKDPFPPTPEGFHLRVEETLSTLEKTKRKHCFPQKKALMLVAMILATLAAATAVAAVAGGARFKDWLRREDSGEVAELVQEVHLGSADGFGFTVDELIWEDNDLYISYSMHAPDDDRYMVALYTPTLNGEKMTCDAKGFTAPKFFDAEAASLLLLGGGHPTVCSGLLTFAVDPRLEQNPDNRLQFIAVLLRTDLDLEGHGSWTDVLIPPRALTFRKDWRDDLPEDEFAALGAEYVDLMDAMAAALGDGALTLDELIASGHAEYVAEREIDMGLDGTKLDADVLYNDVAERDFDRFGLHIHIERFRMTHLGVEIECSVSAPEGRDAAESLSDFVERDWRFCAPEGSLLGPSLGGSGGGSRIASENGEPVWHFTWREGVMLSLNGLDRIAFAPCEYVDDVDGNHPVFDMENAILLTPVYNENVAGITPPPAVEPGELDLSR